MRQWWPAGLRLDAVVRPCGHQRIQRERVVEAGVAGGAELGRGGEILRRRGQAEVI